jgi:hypothetical protein
MDDVENETLDLAQKIFEQMPHNHPNGHVPKWEHQPETIKRAFINKARGGDS